MPIERRIRDGAHRNADVLDPDVDRFLDSVVHRTRRRQIVRRSFSVAASTMIAVAVIVFLGPGLMHGLQSGGGGQIPGDQPSPGLPPVRPLLSGTFARSIPEGTAVVRANGIAGKWTISAGADGTVRLLAPQAFAGARLSDPFELRETTLRTDALGSDVCAGLSSGTYRWSVQDGFLVMSVLSDPCDARIVIFTARRWKPSS